MDDGEFGAKIKALRSDLRAMRDFLKIPGHLDRLYDLAIIGAGKPKRQPKHKRRTSLPDAFPDQAQIDRAKGFWIQRKRRDLYDDAQHQAEAFRDHHLGKGTLAADWPATWGTWMRNALRFSPKPGVNTSLNYPQAVETLAVWKWRVDTFHRGDEEQNIEKGYWNPAWGPRPGEPGCRAPQ